MDAAAFEQVYEAIGESIPFRSAVRVQGVASQHQTGVDDPPSASLSDAGRCPVERGKAASASRLPVVHQAVLHGPDHELLFRMDSHFVLNAVDGVPDAHGLVAPGRGDLGV